MSRPDEYLAIPEEYVRALGGLRWCAGGEAVEYAAESPKVGLTFAMSGEIAGFLEGFRSVRSPIAFGYVLHLLHLLRVGARFFGPEAPSEARLVRLAHAYVEAGRPLRNAGALCGLLCRDVPRAADPPDMAEVCAWLRGQPMSPDPPRPGAELPSLEPAEFEARILKALDRLTDEDLRHWLKHGRGPVGDAGERVADEALASRPRSLAETLAALERRPRLAESAPLVAHLAGAIALPSRRIDPEGPPAGGYADVATRGRPEQILPAQFALDDLEFLRRFAEHELLYFHREEPRARADEELVLLLDQGVRTWGDVRLVLAAAALALGRQAARRGIPLLVTATSARGWLDDASDLDEEELGTLLEASDLSAHPAPALERVLEDRAVRPRDVVLLTHPRSLAEPDVAAAARRVAPGTRLFAIAVDGGGGVELAELRRGVPVALGRCRVTIPAPAGPPSEPPAAPASAGGWTGDVEPIGFPFPLGATEPIDDDLYDFDAAGERILAAVGRLGLLHAWRVDGESVEMLPRAMVGGRPLADVEAVVGVAGGFVVAGRIDGSLVAAHYDFACRTCTAHRLGPPLDSGEGRWDEPYEWSYIRHLHAVVARSPSHPDSPSAVDLAADRREACSRPDVSEPSISRRARLAAFLSRVLPPTSLPIMEGDKAPPGSGHFVCLDAESGGVEARTEIGAWTPFTPLTDGQPTLKKGRILAARAGRVTLGLLAEEFAGRRAIHFFAGPGGQALGCYPAERDLRGFALSGDGRRFARRVGRHSLEVRDVGGGVLPRLRTTRSRVHNRLAVSLGDEFLILRAGNFTHVACWSRGVLSAYSTSDPRKGRHIVEDLPGAVPAVGVTGGIGYDRHRFIGQCSAHGLTALVDALGQVALIDGRGATVAMFFAFRGRWGAWLPDGTRIGPAVLAGASPPPGASERIAEALLNASAKGSVRA